MLGLLLMIAKLISRSSTTFPAPGRCLVAFCKCAEHLSAHLLLICIPTHLLICLSAYLRSNAPQMGSRVFGLCWPQDRGFWKLVLVAMGRGFWVMASGVWKFGSLGISEFSKILKIMRVARRAGGVASYPTHAPTTMSPPPMPLPLRPII
jgi:hypothetical protein